MKVCSSCPTATITALSPCPTESTSLDLRGENHTLVERLKNPISLETVKTSLEKKEKNLAAAQKEASHKAKEAEEKLKAVGKLEEEKKTLEVVAKMSREDLAELKKSYAEWETKLERITAKKTELGQFVKEYVTL